MDLDLFQNSYTSLKLAQVCNLCEKNIQTASLKNYSKNYDTTKKKDEYNYITMSRKYKFYDSETPYFTSFAVVNWIDLFTRREYSDIVIKSLAYCIKHKGLIVNAWCIMTNHVHLIIRSESNLLEDIIRDMKKFTSKELLKALKENPRESRKEWILWMLRRAGERNPNNQTWQVWQQHNHPVELSTNKMIDQRLEYLHINPVKAGFVEKPEDWQYSSARQYAGLPGVLNLEIID